MAEYPRQVQQDLADIEEYERILTAQPEVEQEGETSVDDHPNDAAAQASTDGKDTGDPAPANDQQTVQKRTDTKPDVEPDTWQHRYMTLRGKYDAEVPSLRRQMQDLQAELEQLKAEAERRVDVTKADTSESLVTERDRDEFGDDMIAMVQRVVRSELASTQPNTAQQDVAKLREQVQQTTAKVSEMTFNQRLTSLVPDFFTQVETDPRWIQWLDEYDPMIRSTRRAVASAAYQEGDEHAVADYVQMWKATLASQQAPPPVDTRQAELERQVTPQRSATRRQSTTQTQGRTYTTREMDRQWDQVVELQKRGSLDEAKALERELTTAYTEGRVRA